MQTSLFNHINEDKILTDLFQAYFDARKNKRNTINALAFEKHLEENIFSLFEETMSRQYEPKKSICFIVDQPVKREIFAAHFRDRVIHHFIYNYISPIFEKTFINDSYSCRVGKGTHYGIKRVDHFIRSCSQNYRKPCYILKLDIKGYFMGMNKNILLHKLNCTLKKKKHDIDFDLKLVNYLIDKTVNANPVNNCTIKGKQADWNGLPKDKSLFTAKEGCGFPIGNLTSQLFGNIYMNEFDHFIKRDLKIEYYGRYVDDFILIHNDKEYLKSVIPNIKNYLSNHLKLTLHPNKIYLQHFSKGVSYLGATIKPFYINAGKRTKQKFHESILEYNNLLNNQKFDDESVDTFISSVNSYLGILKHFKTYNFRKDELIKITNNKWFNFIFLNLNYTKVSKYSKKHGSFLIDYAN